MKHPDNAEDFVTMFKKDDDDKRKYTLFLDVDDTLINVSLFLLPGNEFRQIEIEEQCGKVMKVCYTDFRSVF